MIQLVIVMSILFLAVTVAVLAAGMLIRDLWKRRRTQLDQRLGLDILAPEAVPVILGKNQPHGRINDSFEQLVQQSGTGIESNGALALVMGSGTVGCMAMLMLTDNMLAAAGGLLIGILLPLLILAFFAWRRRAQMQKELPELLQMMGDSLRTGQTLERAAELVTRDLSGPLGKEFSCFASQMKLGNSPLAVMQRLVRRIPLPEFRIFATAVLVHRKTGGNLAVLAERLAAVARDRQQFLGHLNAVTAGGRLSAVGLVLVSVFAVVVLSMMEPDYLGRFFTNPMGPALLAIAAVLQLTGILWVWRILRVNY